MHYLKKLSIFFIISIFTSIGWFAHTAYTLPRSSNNPIAEIKPTPLTKYSIESLSNTQVEPTKIEIGEKIKEFDKFTSYKFYFSFDPSLSKSSGETSLKRVSGLINIPKGGGAFPIVVMFRGYVDPTIYFTGLGTSRVGEFFAEQGFITIAPDFLGYGESDHEAGDIFETRFQTYTTALTLLKSISTVEHSHLRIDTNNIFIWGHSNGGQIALTVLEITGADYPTVLWAPVSKPFPYSILYYTDEASDSGKFLRQKTAEFENNYNSDFYSLTNYLDRIKAPIQLNQGTEDDAVPLTWSNQLENKFLDLNLDLDYVKYPGADHNMNPRWQEAIQNSLQFFRKHLQ